MAINMKSVGIPLASFAVAIGISMFGGPARQALGKRQAAATTGCECKVDTIVIEGEAAYTRAAGATILTTITPEATVTWKQEKRSDATASLKVRSWVELKVEYSLTLGVPGQPPLTTPVKDKLKIPLIVSPQDALMTCPGADGDYHASSFMAGLEEDATKKIKKQALEGHPAGTVVDVGGLVFRLLGGKADRHVKIGAHLKADCGVLRIEKNQEVEVHFTGADEDNDSASATASFP